MAFTNTMFHPMLSAAGETAVSASLHTGDPGSDGSSEVSGGDYERQPVSWAAPSGGAIQADGDIVFLVPELGSDEVTHVGLWDADDDWLGSAAASTPQPFPSAGTATVTVLTLDMNTGTMQARVGS